MTPDFSAQLATKLRLARQASGLSTRAVARAIAGREAISHTTLANYESGRTRPTLPVIAVLAEIYARSINWFLSSGPVLRGVQFRNAKSRVSVRDRSVFEGQALRWLEAYRNLETYLNNPLEYKLSFDIREGAARGAERGRFLRGALKLRPDEPIASVGELLENAGIRAIETKTDLQIDGMAAKWGDENIVISSITTSNDRARLTMAHELIHIASQDCSCQSGTDERQREKEAFEGASHLLLTDEMLEAAFSGRSFVRLVQFKERFGISMAAMVYRAQQASIISDRQTRAIWMQFSKRGWRAAGKEPGQVRPDRLTRFEQLLDGAITQRRLTWTRASQVTGMRESDLRTRLEMAAGTRSPHDDYGRG